MSRRPRRSALLALLALAWGGCDLEPFPGRDKAAGGSDAQGSTSASATTSSTGTGGQGGAAGAGGSGGAPCADLPCECDFDKIGTRCTPDSECTGCVCPDGWKNCDNTSPDCETNINTDPAHCGACSQHCNDGFDQAVCHQGVCACANGAPYCDTLDGCFGSLVDPYNCGACGTYCPVGQLCNNGICQCPPGKIACPIGCSDLTDVGHCGSCSNDCTKNSNPYCSWQCLEGLCVSEISCPAGTAFCGSCYDLGGTSCTDILSTIYQCGGCGIVCPTGGPNTANGCVNGQCTLTCSSSSFADCNGDLLGDGCELPVGSDPLNCGSCAHSCLPGGCLNGKCAPFVIAQAQLTPLAIAQDAASLYWVNGGSGGPDGEVVQAAKAVGAAPLILASGLVSPAGLVVVGGEVAWIEKGHPGQSDGAVWKVPVGGGLPVLVAAGQAYPLGIAADATNLYWTAHEGGALFSAPLAGGPPTQVAALSGPRRVAVDAGYAYVTQLNGSLVRTPVAGGPVDLLAAGLADPWGVVVDPGFAYVRLASGSIVSVPVAGGATKGLAGGLDATKDLTLDGAHLVYGSQGSLLRTPVGGGGMLTLTVHAATAVVADTPAWYWVEATSGTVWGLAR